MLFFIIIKHKSQRIKNKNFKYLGHQELWKHLIYKLKGQKVYIDTDSNRVLKDTKKIFPWVCAYKREQKFVKMEEKKNSSPTLLMIKNFLDNYVGNSNEIIVTTHVTSPFIRLATIKKAAKKLKYYDSVAAVTKDYNFAWILKKNKIVPINFDPKHVTKTQNLNPIIQSNGAFFIFKKKTFLKYNNRMGKKPYFFEINYPENIEIDTMDDLKLARALCK